MFKNGRLVSTNKPISIFKSVLRQSGAGFFIKSSTWNSVLCLRNLHYTFWQPKIITMLKSKIRWRAQYDFAKILNIFFFFFLHDSSEISNHFSILTCVTFLGIPPQNYKPSLLTLHGTGYCCTPETVSGYATCGWSIITDCSHAQFSEYLNVQVNIIRLFS
jgi:hypothetical protein